MQEQLTIGAVARLTGLPVDTLRFYEAEELIPAPARTAAGYRLYTDTDVRRLRFIRQLRLLDLPLAEVKVLTNRAFVSECGAFGQQLLDLVEQQRAAVDGRIAELQAVRLALDALVAPARQVAEGAPRGLTVAACGRCPVVDEPGSIGEYCHCEPLSIPA